MTTSEKMYIGSLGLFSSAISLTDLFTAKPLPVPFKNI